MAFVYEVNGQRVEFDREPTDADIDEAARSLGAAKSAPGVGEIVPEPGVAELATGAIAPTLTGIGAQPLGASISGMASVAKPILQTAKEVYSGPMGVFRGVADATMMAHGIPPLAGGLGAAENVAKRYQGVAAAAGEASKALSQTPLVTSPVSGAQYPGGVPDYRAMQAAAPGSAARLTEVYAAGGPNAVKAFLQTPEAAQYMKDPAFRAAAESYGAKVPGLLSQAGKVVAPVLKGAARIAGPAGMAMNLYDASQMAEQTQLGPRLAAGQGQAAEQAFRAGPVQSYQGPQIPAAQAQNVLQSGSARDIQYFGGRDRLTELMRRKAAEKVLGPIAP